MSNHHFHRSAGPFTILLFYYFISIRFQAEVFASRVAKPECRTTIFTGRPAVVASRVVKPECRTTIFTGRPAAFSRGCFASRTAFFACRLTFLHIGQTYPPFQSSPKNHFTGWSSILLGLLLSATMVDKVLSEVDKGWEVLSTQGWRKVELRSKTG